jgi:hypothetical protein
MPRKAKVMALSLAEETRSALPVLAHSRTAPAHHVERSAIILRLADRCSASETAAALGINRHGSRAALEGPQSSHCSRRSTTCRVRDARRSSRRRRGLG